MTTDLVMRNKKLFDLWSGGRDFLHCYRENLFDITALENAKFLTQKANIAFAQ